VLRLREGAEVSLFDGEGRAARAEVARISGREVELRVIDPEPSRESPLALTIAVAPPRGDRMSFLVEKLTELGVSRIVPLQTERGRSSESVERWRRVAMEACKQSGRSLAPACEEPRSVASVLDEPGAVLVAHPGAPPLATGSGIERVLVLVGPEGGWSEKELASARTRGAAFFGLGPRTLRTETAAIAVATLLEYRSGDLGGS
jgi:16S rRNA (uracil1498-N3)-methyltransferase